MSIVGAISTGIGIINSINAANAARAAANEARRQQQEAIRAQREQYDRILGAYQDANASGVYNSAERENLLNRQFDYGTNVANKNAAASLYGAGNRAGDSAYTNAGHQISEKSSLARANAIMGAKDYAHNLQFGDIGRVNSAQSQYANSIYDASNRNMAYAREDMAGTDPTKYLTDVLSNSENIFDFLRPRKKKPVEDPADPYKIASGDMNPNHVYDRNGNPINGDWLPPGYNPYDPYLNPKNAPYGAKVRSI